MIRKYVSIQIIGLLSTMTILLSGCGSSSQQAESWNSYYYGGSSGSDNDSNYSLPSGTWSDAEMYRHTQGGY